MEAIDMAALEKKIYCILCQVSILGTMVRRGNISLTQK